jgi:hypothetical protein
VSHRDGGSALIGVFRTGQRELVDHHTHTLAKSCVVGALVEDRRLA